MKNYRLLIPLIFIGLATSSLLAQNRNIFPPNSLGNGRVGIGPILTSSNFNPVIFPQDLLHIEGTNPINQNPYNEATLRISLDDNDPSILNRQPCNPPAGFVTCPSQIYGQLSLQNDFSAQGITPPIVKYSSFAKKYDFVLSTANPIDLALTHSSSCNYKFDLIISAKNPQAAIRFGTTPLNSPINPTPNDLERVTILNNGNVGVGNTLPDALFQVGSNFLSVLSNGNVGVGTDNPKAPFQVGENITIIPTTDPLVAPGTWGSISYNNFFDASTNSAKRIKNGAANGVTFIPESPQHKTNPLLDPTTPSLGEGNNGGVSLWAERSGSLNTTELSGSGLTLRPEKLFLNMWSNTNNSTTTNAYEELFDYKFPTWNSDKTDLNPDGQLYIRDRVFIGTANFIDNHPPFNASGFYELSVNGSILAKEIVVDAHATWSDFVFDKDYNLLSLYDVENYIKRNHHLPDIPSAKEVGDNGQNIGSMQAKLLRKVEELTLYLIDLKKENARLQKHLESIENNKE